ncbi:hypothetical protein PISMIDRAFT_677583 [Pisolithus microcarpus 441]|uniref:Unplaced genomic scaffold scaffold_27, whole genome shotgun sequence n=1 Tax=Pisolithus microcarpus 441 TaxID=765257 RepID=A0A0C9ZS47_9AGAM|nr:hypothetical protein PISMIDRAFT_677583 [Pisolithus microcarpus 441]
MRWLTTGVESSIATDELDKPGSSGTVAVPCAVTRAQAIIDRTQSPRVWGLSAKFRTMSAHSARW